MILKSYVVDSGGARAVEPQTACDARGAADLVWLHLDANSAKARGWLATGAGLPDVAVSALVASETRPRTESFDGSTLVNLRGFSVAREESPDLLSSIRIWADKGRVISVSVRDLSALSEVEHLVLEGRVHDPGDLIAALATAISDELDPDVAALGDTLDDCEEKLDGRRIFEKRQTISRVRAKAITYRRFVAPQRAALERLSALQTDWIEEQDRLALNEAADRAARMVEELESVRERAALMHEQLTDLRAEQLDTRALLISIVALIFLPLTFVTGLLGMNVEGIPYAHSPWSFWGVVVFCLAVGALTAAYFIRNHWIRR